MFRRINDFADEWQVERSNTIKVLQELTDESLSQAIVPGGRTLGFLGWHITQTLGEMMGHTGLEPDAPAMDTPPPSRASEILAAYQVGSASVLQQVTTQWSDDMLDDDIAMYGTTFKRGFVLDMLIRHEAHHRGQMTVLMRQAGLRVPGPYGPGREEWLAMGLEPHP
ncbi:MAG TPA: DinB family protein [Longimicrobiales bacterium]|nr:DinB family protein [Longimicrobiales bacterium]